MSARFMPALVLLLAASTPAAAQQRLVMDDVPDTALFDATSADGRLRAELTAGTEAHGSLTDDDGRSGAVAATAELHAGFQPAANRKLFLRSSLLVPSTGDGGFEASGRHRLLGLYGFGAADPGDVFADLQLDQRLDHGPEPLPGSRPDLGPAPFVDNDIEVASWAGRLQERGGNGHLGKGGYLVVRRRDVHYDGVDTPVRALRTTELTAGFGVRGYHREVMSGARNMLWVTRSRTSLEPGAAALKETPTSLDIDRTDVAIGAREIVFHIGTADRLQIGLSQGIGWSWLRTDDGRDANMLTIDDVATMRARDASLAVGFSRRPAITPDGGRLVADWRITAMVGALSRKNNVGGTAQFVANILDDLHADGNATRYHFHNELYTVLKDAGSATLGVYHLASLAPLRGNTDWDPWSAGKRWNNELGMFLRWSLSSR
jgi:hypothetical protein